MNIDSKRRTQLDSQVPDSLQADLEQSLSERIIAAVAIMENTPAMELQPPLYEVIDPDALDAIFTGKQTHESSEAFVEFEYVGHRVCVRANGEISID